MNMQINVRRATHDDLGALKHLEQQLINFERQFDPDIREGENVHYYDLEKLLMQDNISLIVAEVDNKIVGCAFGKIVKAPDWSESEYIGHIKMVFVEEEYRKKGVGRAIFAGLKKWFREKQAASVYVEFYLDNTNALEAYKKYGFKPYTMIMKMGEGGDS